MESDTTNPRSSLRGRERERERERERDNNGKPSDY